MEFKYNVALKLSFHLAIQCFCNSIKNPTVSLF